MGDQLQPNGNGGDLDAQAKLAHKVETHIIELFNQETATRWEITKWLDKFLENRLYELPGIECESENEWFGQPYVPWSRGYARGLLAIYRELVKNRGVGLDELNGIDYRNLGDGLPLLRDGKVTAKRLLSDAKALSRSDMRQHYAEGPDAPLDAEREPVRVKCPTCDQWTTEDKLAERQAA